MSYLDPPRFSFSGIFTATPSTINNSTENYPLGTQYNNNPPTALNPQSVWWNPGGWALFTVGATNPQLPPAIVNGACLELGTTITTGDSLIGGTVTSVLNGHSPGHQARLVDLDPDQQARSMIVGMKLQITTTDGATVTGTVAPMCIIDVWGRLQGTGGGSIMGAGCMYQSVIGDLTWVGVSSTGSQVFKALYAASPQALSIKFSVDAYNGIAQDPLFTRGRIVGTIGPYLDLAPGVPEPLHVLAQRRIYAGGDQVAAGSPLNPAPFQVKNGYLTIDLGNSIPTVGSAANPQLAGNFMELGPVTLVANGAPIATLFSTAAQFAAAYQTSAGIYDVLLTAEQQQTLLSTPLGLTIGPSSAAALGGQMTAQEVRQAKEGLRFPVAAGAAIAAATLALAENANGLFASLDFNALRLANGAPPWSSAAMSGTEITGNAQVPLYATLFGAPAARYPIAFQTAFNQYQFPGSDGLPQYINNDPKGAIDPPPTGYLPPASGQAPTVATVTLDANGVGTFDVTAYGLTQLQIQQVQGNRRALPSQLYLYTHDGSMDTIGLPITFVVFIDTPGPASPTWTDDVQPILGQYAQLYPGMRSIVDLGNFATVVANLGRFQLVMNLPMSDPGMMPVTRDLAPVQLATINAWFANPQQ